MQRNWIGKSEGCEFEMKLANPHPNLLLKEKERATNFAQNKASSSPLGEELR